MPSAVSVLFSEPKIPQSVRLRRKALNGNEFQCSSASRKFLNLTRDLYGDMLNNRFSALQRAENSSMSYFALTAQVCIGVSVLFSEPKIPQ